jgi:hypothetical protein
MDKIYVLIGRQKYEQRACGEKTVLVEQISRARSGARSCERVRKVIVQIADRSVTFQVGNFSGIPEFHIFPATAERSDVLARKGAQSVRHTLEKAITRCLEIA